MTTTEPTTTQAWLDLDGLCPPEMREEGHRLLEQVQAIREALTPLVPRIGAFIRASNDRANAAEADVLRVAGPDAAHEISNGLGQLVGTLTGADELYHEMAVLGLEDEVGSIRGGTEVAD